MGVDHIYKYLKTIARVQVWNVGFSETKGKVSLMSVLVVTDFLFKKHAWSPVLQINTSKKEYLEQFYIWLIFLTGGQSKKSYILVLF